jgi:RNA polymerase sigma factor (sigma-70 family)
LTSPFSSFLRHFRRQVVLPDAGEVTDRDLLQRFARGRDGDAFAALVQRYGPLVLGVCRRVLRQEQDAEDAFQATFLVLARKAGSISQPERLGNWLYGVASRVAQKARGEATRRRARQQPVTDVPASRGDPEADWEDLRQVLDDEVQRLPDKFCAPLVLCYLQGMTREEAAARLGRSAGAVKGLLERGRELLRSRLARRGVTLSLGSLAAMLSGNALSAAVPAVLRDSTVRAALVFAAGKAPAAGSAAALAQGVLQAMFMYWVKRWLAVVLMLGLAGGGAGLLAFGGRPAEDPVAPKPAFAVAGGEGNEAENMYRDLEKRVTQAKTVRVAFEGRLMNGAKGAGHMKGVITLGEENRARMEFKGQVNEKDLSLEMTSDGKKLKAVATPPGEETEEPLPENYGAIVRTGLVRVGPTAGLLLAHLSLRGKVEKDLDKLLRPSDFKLGANVKAEGRDARVLEYKVTPTGAGPVTLKLWLDAKTRLPLKRELGDEKKGFRIVETYSEFKLSAASGTKSSEAEPTPKAGEKADQLKRLAAARLDTAKTAYEGFWLVYQAGRGPEEAVHLWSRRWLQAQLDLSDKKADRDAALASYQERLKKTDAIARARLVLGNSPAFRLKMAPDKTGREKYETLWKAYQESKTSEEQVCLASLQWLMYQHLLNRRVQEFDPKAELQAHLDRIQKVEAIAKERFDAGRTALADYKTATFFRLQAEEWLAQGKTFEAKDLEPGAPSK